MWLFTGVRKYLTLYKGEKMAESELLLKVEMEEEEEEEKPDVLFSEVFVACKEEEEEELARYRYWYR